MEQNMMEKQNHPRVTVIMCNYNYADYINEAIDSVLRQTYADFEFIIVDDGSEDNSRDVISAYRDHRIKTILKPNGGQASAFNHGFSKASGDIVSFIDSDDWWKPEKISTVVKWHDFLGGQYSVLQHAMDVMQDDRKWPYKYTLPVGNCLEEMRKTGRIDYFVPTSGLTFRKSVLEKVFPIPERFNVCADAYIMRAAFVFGDVYSIPQPLGFYRKHRNAVFGNSRFDINTFLSQDLVPELNKFYAKTGIDYRLDAGKKNGGHDREKKTFFYDPAAFEVYKEGIVKKRLYGKL